MKSIIPGSIIVYKEEYDAHKSLATKLISELQEVADELTTDIPIKAQVIEETESYIEVASVLGNSETPCNDGTLINFIKEDTEEVAVKWFNKLEEEGLYDVVEFLEDIKGYKNNK